jgi:hypothetical protein
MNNLPSSEMRPAERLLVSLTTPPWCALYLVPAGFSIFPIYHFSLGNNRSAPGLAVVFFGVLLVLRFGPAVGRRFIPVSKAVQAGWFRNRLFAKRYDSYQWQKLFWFGWGIFVYSAFFSRLGGTPMALAAVCVVTGAIAAVVWQKRERRLRKENRLFDECPPYERAISLSKV